MSNEAADQTRTLPTVLVLDDHEGVRLTLQLIFKRSGYRVLCADSGACAVMLASTEPIDVALIDVHMPGMTGFECMRVIQQNREPRRGPLRVWFMTGAPTPEIARAAVQAGALGVLQKPFDFADLLTTVKSGLSAPLPPVSQQSA